MSLLGYLYLIGRLIFRRKNTLRIFSKVFFYQRKEFVNLICLERFSTPKENKDWTDFEQAATYHYTRTFVDRMYHGRSTYYSDVIIIFFYSRFLFLLHIDFLKQTN